MAAIFEYQNAKKNQNGFIQETFRHKVLSISTNGSRDIFIFVFMLGPGFDTRSGHILSFLLPLIQEGQLSVTGESMCTKYWLTA